MRSDEERRTEGWSESYRSIPPITITNNPFRARFAHFPHRSLDILIHPTYGDPDVYIKMDVSNDETASKSNFDISSIRDQYHDDRVTIGEGSICTECTISVAILGFTKSHYSLTAVTADVITELSDGKPFKEGVGGGVTQDFMYTSSDDGDVMVILTMLSGVAWLTAAENRTFADPEHCLLGSPCKKDHSAANSQVR